MKLLFSILIITFCSTSYALECKRTEFPFNKEKISNKKDFLKLQRQQTFEYLLFELTNEKPHIELARNLYFTLYNKETNHDVKMFLEVIHSASDLGENKVKTLNFTDVCKIHKSTIGKS